MDTHKTIAHLRSIGLHILANNMERRQADLMQAVNAHRSRNYGRRWRANNGQEF